MLILKVILWHLCNRSGESSNQNFVSNDNTSSLDNSISQAGAGYLFSKEVDSWEQKAYLKAFNNENSVETKYGDSVSISGNTLVIGAYKEDGKGSSIINKNIKAEDKFSVCAQSWQVSLGYPAYTSCPWDFSSTNTGAAFVYAK